MAIKDDKFIEYHWPYFWLSRSVIKLIIHLHKHALSLLSTEPYSALQAACPCLSTLSSGSQSLTAQGPTLPISTGYFCSRCSWARSSSSYLSHSSSPTFGSCPLTSSAPTTSLSSKIPAAHGIIAGHPYGIVRHSAAAGFLWLFWSFPSYTTNHLFYTLQWTIFILVGTLFEEGGIKKDDTEFGRQYKKYSSAVSAFIPRIVFFFGRPIKID